MGGAARTTRVTTPSHLSGDSKRWFGAGLRCGVQKMHTVRPNGRGGTPRLFSHRPWSIPAPCSIYADGSRDGADARIPRRGASLAITRTRGRDHRAVDTNTGSAEHCTPTDHNSRVQLRKSPAVNLVTVLARVRWGME